MGVTWGRALLAFVILFKVEIYRLPIWGFLASCSGGRKILARSFNKFENGPSHAAPIFPPPPITLSISRYLSPRLRFCFCFRVRVSGFDLWSILWKVCDFVILLFSPYFFLIFWKLFFWLFWFIWFQWRRLELGAASSCKNFFSNAYQLFGEELDFNTFLDSFLGQWHVFFLSVVFIIFLPYHMLLSHNFFLSWVCGVLLCITIERSCKLYLEKKNVFSFFSIDSK